MVLNKKEESVRNVLDVAFMAVLVLAATVTPATAGITPAVPEISPGSLSAGLALLAGGVLLVRARLRK